VPPPVLVAVSVYEIFVKVAATLCAEFIVTVQLPVPVQAPLQPAKVEVASAAAVNVTDDTGEYVAEHVEPQLMPPTLLVTVPEPVPAFVTVNTFGFFVNVALTDFAESTVTMHGPVPEQTPLQPVNVEPLSGVAVRVTSAF
jgi:hypothetical protein